MTPPARVSHERVFLDAVRNEVERIPGAEVFSGLKPENRYELKGWELNLIQRFQFGDLRIEVPDSTVVIEVESAGGVGNLVKYWPLLRDGSLDKRFVLVHVFRITSDGDYIAHRRLWTFLVERMRADLEQQGLTWPDRWEARAFTYREATSANLAEVLGFVRSTCARVS